MAAAEFTLQLLPSRVKPNSLAGTRDDRAGTDVRSAGLNTSPASASRTKIQQLGSCSICDGDRAYRYSCWCRRVVLNLGSARMEQPAVSRDGLLSVDELDVNDSTVYAVGRCMVTTVYLDSGVAIA